MKACPFCGGTHIVLIRENGSTWNKCSRCQCRGPLLVDADDDYCDWDMRITEPEFAKLEKFRGIMDDYRLGLIQDQLVLALEEAEAEGAELIDRLLLSESIEAIKQAKEALDEKEQSR